jgi:hypothetical protein
VARCEVEVEVLLVAGWLAGLIVIIFIIPVPI